jgi:hypothetical protein
MLKSSVFIWNLRVNLIEGLYKKGFALKKDITMEVIKSWDLWQKTVHIPLPLQKRANKIDLTEIL